MTEQQILEALQKLGKSEELSFLAVVEANHVDTVDVVDLSGTKYEGVRKKAAITGTTAGMLITPALNSSVIVSRIGESDELFLEMVSEIESIVMDGGANEGLVKVNELTDKLNTLEQDLNSLKTIFKTTWIVAPSDGGAALKTAAMTWANQTLTETNKGEIQNEKFKH